MEHVGQLNRVVAFDGDEVLDADVDGIADPYVVAAAVLTVGDGCLVHPEHLADQRAEHRGRPARLPGQHRFELGGLAVGRSVIEVDPTRRLPSAMTGGVSRNSAKLRLLTPRPSISPDCR